MIDYNNLTREQLAIARVKCDASLLYFTRFWFRVLKNQKFIVNWHHEEICAELDKIESYQLELLNINIPIFQIFQKKGYILKSIYIIVILEYVCKTGCFFGIIGMWNYWTNI